MRTRDWKWIVGVLSSIIVFLLTYKIWGKSGNLIEVISIGSGLTSIALAITAIIIAVSEGVKSSIKEQKAHGALDSIITNIQVMKDVLSGVSKDNLKTHDQLSKIEEYVKFYGSNKEETPVGVEIQYSKIDKGGLEEKTNNEVDSNEEKRVQVESAKGEEASSDNKIISSKPPIEKTINFASVKRGDIFLADLSPVIGSEQGGTRPVVVIQNEIANRFSPTVTVAPLTTQIQKAKLPSHVEISAAKYELESDSVILLEQIRTIDKFRLYDKIANLDKDALEEIDKGILVHLGLVKF